MNKYIKLSQYPRNHKVPRYLRSNRKEYIKIKNKSYLSAFDTSYFKSMYVVSICESYLYKFKVSYGVANYYSL